MSEGFSFHWRGMEFYEREAVARATEIVLRETREQYLPLLEEWRAKTDDPAEQAIADAEIRRLRRLLGIIVTSDEARRAASREGVRRHRERKKKRQAEVGREIEGTKQEAKG